VRLLPLWLCLYFLLPVPPPVQATHPRPPGITEGQRQIDKPIEPPMEAHSRKMNVDQVKKEAEELKKLADGVPAQIELVIKNQ